MKQSSKLNQLLFSGPENSNRNQNFNNINIVTLENSNIYENNRERFIKTEVSYYNNNNNFNENTHNVSFCTKGGGDKPENIDFSGTSRNTEVYDIYNETTSTNHKNYFDNGNCTDVNIKNKIMNINSSLKSFGIHVKNKLISYADFESSRNKNSYINFLLDYIVDLLWIVKADREAKTELVQKLHSSNFKFEEYERKIKKMGSELSETKKYLNNALNKNLNDKEKNNLGNDTSKNKNYGLALSTSKRKNNGTGFYNNNNNKINNDFIGNGNGNDIESEFALVKAENKKINSQLTILKNEIKKKELEFSKLQDKLKKLLNDKIAVQPASSAGLNNSFSNHNNNNFNPIGSINNNNNSSVRNRSRNNNSNLSFDIFKLSSFIGYDLSNHNLNGNKGKKYSNNQKNESLNQLKNLYKKFLEFNTQNNIMKKYDSLLNQNTILMGVLFNFQESLDKINQKIIFFNRNNTKIKTELLDLIKLKENIFSLHLIDKELLEEFSDNFLENIKMLEDIILRIMESIFYENSEWKQKYQKLEKEFVQRRGHLPANKSNHALNSNDNYDSKDSNSLINYENANENNNHNTNKNKDKDLIKNLKRWSIRASVKGSNLSSMNNDRNTKRISNFAGGIFSDEVNMNNLDGGRFSNFNENQTESDNYHNRLNESTKRNQSLNSYKFL